LAYGLNATMPESLKIATESQCDTLCHLQIGAYSILAANLEYPKNAKAFYVAHFAELELFFTQR